MADKLVIKMPAKDGDPEDMDAGMLPKAFPVPIDDDDDDEDESPPMDGLEYIKRVIKERRNVPDTVVANIHPDKLKKRDSTTVRMKHVSTGFERKKSPLPDELCPGIRWQNEQVAQFSEVRSKLTRHGSLVRKNNEQTKLPKVPVKNNELLWCLFCHGSDVWKCIREAREKPGEENDNSDSESNEKSKKLNPMYDQVIEDFPNSSPPTVSVIMSIPFHVVAQLIEYQITWLKLIGWRPSFGPWLYSLLARLEKPLDPDIESVLRDLVFFCSQDRYHRYQRKSQESQKSDVESNLQGSLTKDDHKEEEDEESVDPVVAAYNVFICLVSRYFSQSDLIDERQ